MKYSIALPATILTLVLATATQARPFLPGLGMGHEDRMDQRMERMTEQLDLTAEQQEQIRKIFEAERAKRAEERAAVRKQIDDLLTDEQRKVRGEQVTRKIDRAVDRLGDRLNLTKEQESKLRTMMVEARDNPNWSPTKMRASLSEVLTEDQLAKLDEMRPNRKSRGRGHCKN